jgi:acetyltransferase-like isoleucine patch superfamily enzyme
MSGIDPTARIHELASVEDGAAIGPGASVWHHAQVRSGASIGPGCIIGKGAYIGADVQIGANCKVQNYSCVYEGMRLEAGVFVGPEVVFTNDRYPRAINPDGTLKTAEDWDCGETLVKYGAAIGARSVILPGLTIGRWALVAAGSVVTRNVADHALVVGHPAKEIGWVCVCARRLDTQLICPACGRRYGRADHGLELIDTKRPERHQP